MLLLTHPGQSQGRWLGLKLMIQILAKLLNTEIMDRTVLNLNINSVSSVRDSAYLLPTIIYSALGAERTVAPGPSAPLSIYQLFKLVNCASL